MVYVMRPIKAPTTIQYEVILNDVTLQGRGGGFRLLWRCVMQGRGG